MQAFYRKQSCRTMAAPNTGSRKAAQVRNVLHFTEAVCRITLLLLSIVFLLEITGIVLARCGSSCALVRHAPIFGLIDLPTYLLLFYAFVGLWGQTRQAPSVVQYPLIALDLVAVLVAAGLQVFLRLEYSTQCSQCLSTFALVALATFLHALRLGGGQHLSLKWLQFPAAILVLFVVSTWEIKDVQGPWVKTSLPLTSVLDDSESIGDTLVLFVDPACTACKPVVQNALEDASRSGYSVKVRFTDAVGHESSRRVARVVLLARMRGCETQLLQRTFVGKPPENLVVQTAISLGVPKDELTRAIAGEVPAIERTLESDRQAFVALKSYRLPGQYFVSKSVVWKR